MGDPKEMAKWTHKVEVNGELHSVGTKERCEMIANGLVKSGWYDPEEMIVIPLDGTEDLR